MPKPNGSSNLSYDKFLTSLLMGFRNEDAAYGHLSVPSILHDDESGLYPVLKNSDLLRIAAGERPRGTPAPMSGFGVEQGSFACVPYGYKQPIDKDDAHKAKDPLDLDMAALQHVSDQLQMLNESKFATAAFSTSTWGTTDQAGVASGATTNQFNRWNTSGATPKKDVRARASEILRLTGKKPNVLFVPDDVDAALVVCPDVVDQIKYTNPNAIDMGRVTDPVEMAKYFGVKKYVVCGATRNTALENATAVYAFFASNKALLCYLDMPGEAQPALSLANARFRPTALAAIRYDLPDGEEGKRVTRYYDHPIKSNVVEGDESFVYHRPLIEGSGANPLGQLFTAVLS